MTSWKFCSNKLLPLNVAEVVVSKPLPRPLIRPPPMPLKPLHDESDEIISNVVAEPGDENVASNEPPPRLCTDGDFGITLVIVVAPNDMVADGEDAAAAAAAAKAATVELLLPMELLCFVLV